MAKALVAYVGRTGQTKKIGELIAEGLRMAGVETDFEELARLTKPEDLDGYDAYVFGSATYHGEMMQPMKTFLFMLENAKLEGKVGGAFGAFGWSGEAPGRIYDTMLHIMKMDMVGDPLKLKSAAIQGGREMAQDYGKKVAQKVSGA